MVFLLSSKPNPDNGKGGMHLIISFLLSVGAGIVTGFILYFAGKWLDRKFDDD